MDGEFFGSGIKRVNDDGLTAGNGTGDSDAKKAKFENNGPSRVVHIRGLPLDATDHEVIQLGIPFGKMTNILRLKDKCQAFLEFEDDANAQTMVNVLSSTPTNIRKKHIYVQFSNHKELKTDNNILNSSCLRELQVIQGMLPALTGGSAVNTCNEPNTILRVIVENVCYPVTLEVLHQVFSRYGKIQKIITFNKNNIFQSLIQFADPISAATAKDSLDSQNIYNGCNTLRIEYSRLTVLQVKFNNDKSRDFTNPDLPTGEDNNMPLNGNFNNMGAGVLGAGGNTMGGLGQMTGGFNFGMATGMNIGNSMTAMGASGEGTGSPCILVSNLDEQKTTPDSLFVLFGVYGNVHRVKILFNKKDNALVQMSCPSQAQQAITYLDRVKVWGKQLRVAPSRHQLIQMPKDGQSDAGLTKDFVASPHHRFKRSGSKNYIFPPTQVLHLYNVQDLEERDIQDLFSNYGTIKGFKFFNNDRKMALIEMASVEEAIHALMGLHNYQVRENLNLRVSFSKSTI